MGIYGGGLFTINPNEVLSHFLYYDLLVCQSLHYMNTINTLYIDHGTPGVDTHKIYNFH